MGSGGNVAILAERVRACIDRPFAVKRMFGGLSFMLQGNMLCCVSKNGLMVRVGAAAEPEALAHPFVARCMGTGRPMRGFLLVEHQGVTTDDDLRAWIGRALSYVGGLPAKKPKARRPPPFARRAITRVSRRVP